MSLFKGVANDAKDAAQELAVTAEQQGEKLAAAVEVDLADLVKRLLEEGSGYKLVLTLSIEKK